MTDFSDPMPSSDLLDDGLIEPDGELEVPAVFEPTDDGDPGDAGDGGSSSTNQKSSRSRRRGDEVPRRATIERIISIVTASPSAARGMDAVFDVADGLSDADRVHRILSRSEEVRSALGVITNIRELDAMEAAVVATDLASDKAAFSPVAGILVRLGALTLPRQSAPGKAGLALAKAIHGMSDAHARALDEAVEAAQL